MTSEVWASAGPTAWSRWPGVSFDRGGLPVHGGQRPHLSIAALLETPAGRPRSPGGAARPGLSDLGPGPPPDSSRRRDHSHPPQRQRRPSARRKEIPDRLSQDEQGLRRPGPPLRVAGMRQAAGPVSAPPRAALGLGRQDGRRRDEPVVLSPPAAAQSRLAAEAAAGPPNGRAPTHAHGYGRRRRRTRITCRSVELRGDPMMATAPQSQRQSSDSLPLSSLSPSPAPGMTALTTLPLPVPQW
jgi:hypothetical protein